MSAKDPFQILADELTLIRKDMDRLQRTSLDKDEAQALHESVTKALTDMRKATREESTSKRGAIRLPWVFPRFVSARGTIVRIWCGGFRRGFGFLFAA